MNIMIITGASSGMGEQFAIQLDTLIDRVDEIWLVARRKEKLKELSKLLRHKCRIFPIDVTSEIQLDLLQECLETYNAKVKFLVNAAGVGFMGNFEENERECALEMLRLNCQALTSLTHRVIPYMVKGGRIIQLASSAAFLPQADFAVYAASKSYVLSFSRALNRELKDKQIYVTAVCPGPVDTPFFDIAERTGTTLAIKKYFMADAIDVVNLAIHDSYLKKDISIYGTAMKCFAAVSKVVPQSLMLTACDIVKKKK